MIIPMPPKRYRKIKGNIPPLNIIGTVPPVGLWKSCKVSKNPPNNTPKAAPATTIPIFNHGKLNLIFPIAGSFEISMPFSINNNRSFALAL